MTCEAKKKSVCVWKGCSQNRVCFCNVVCQVQYNLTYAATMTIFCSRIAGPHCTVYFCHGQAGISGGVLEKGWLWTAEGAISPQHRTHQLAFVLQTVTPRREVPFFFLSQGSRFYIRKISSRTTKLNSRLNCTQIRMMAPQFLSHIDGI